MITNYVQRTRKTTLLNERAKLVQEQEQLAAIVQASGISKNAARKAKVGHLKIDERSLIVRENAIFKMEENRLKLIEIKQKIREINEQEDINKNNKLLEVFKDIFTQDQIIEIKQEAERRMNGQSGFKFSFSVKDAIAKNESAAIYKRVALEQMEKMIEFRIMLTKVIEDGCKKFDQGEFLKVISPLNRLIIPLNDLNKAKLKLQSLQ